MYIPYENMVDTSRVWVYFANRPFTEEEKTWMISKLVTFCNQWNTHGSLMPTSFDIQHDQFILLSVDESKMGASGCSIDSSVRLLREIEQHINVEILDAGKVAYLHEDKVTVTKLPDVNTAIRQGKLTPDSPVFNPSVSKKSELESNWLIPAKESWLKRYFNNQQITQ
ncbi:hypothetical protein [Pleomorphovibrio marinus]|uniref:hypothetical protein n=1 Tax=Pleomorphovibrio marinus TaxID=2164132 RepID=UPI000E0C99FC|nr:hypothetical protein [Pleomorphovibrio marinus]